MVMKDAMDKKPNHSFLWYKKAQNNGKSPKNDCVTRLRNLQDVCEHPVCYFWSLIVLFYGLFACQNYIFFLKKRVTKGLCKYS